MVKLLSILSIVLAIVLFPPAALAVISNNAVPGDVTYPIKRVLEDGIFAVASLNPVTKAWFAAARSDRRYKEVAVLLTSGKGVSDTLNELVEQTQIAADQISQVSNETQKQQLVEQLTESIQKYDQGLEKLVPSQKTPAETPALPNEVQPIPEQSEEPAAPIPEETPLPKVNPSPKQTPQPTEGSVVSPTVPATPVPVATTRPVLAPIPTLQPAGVPVVSKNDEKEKEKQKVVKEAREKLEEIKRKLEKGEKKEQKENKNGTSNLTPKNDTGKLNNEKRR